MKKKANKQINKAKLIITLLVIIVAVALLAAYFIAKNYSSPLSSVRRMFSLRADMKLEEYYKCFDIPDYSKNPANTLEAYLDMAEQKGWDKIESFKVEQLSDLTFKVTYGDNVEELKLIPTGEKSMLFFKNYKIKIESVSSPLLYIVTHKGAEISFDGTVLEDNLKVVEADIAKEYEKSENLEESDLPTEDISRKTPIYYFNYYDDIYDNYCFINAFDKEFDLNITTDYTDPYTTSVTPSEMPHVLRDLKLNDESEKQIGEAAENFMKKYYYAMQDGESFDSISNLITEDAELREEFRLDYEELYGLFVRGDDEKQGIIDICFLESESSISYPGKYSLNQAEYIANVTLVYSYNYSLYNGLTKEYELYSDVIDETLFTLCCVKENGKWVITKVEDTMINLYV